MSDPCHCACEIGKKETMKKEGEKRRRNNEKNYEKRSKAREEKKDDPGPVCRSLAHQFNVNRLA